MRIVSYTELRLPRSVKPKSRFLLVFSVFQATKQKCKINKKLAKGSHVSLRDLEDNTAASSSEEDNSPSSLTLEEAFLSSPALGFAFAGFDDAVAFTTTALSISSISLSLKSLR